MLAVVLSLFVLFFVKSCYAIYDPLSVPNNRFGIHIADFTDIDDVAPLVNSQGGDWGYVTLVATDNDRDPSKWQAMFDQMRRLHLIPLVRLATHVQGDTWVIPDKDRLDELVSFFAKLNWPTENRYIILYNEPNHAKEWGGIIDPEGYAEIASLLAEKFKHASDDFFILPAGLDVSAATDGNALDAADFLRRMVGAKPDLLSKLDGWTSHSYPNPGFSGSPYATNRGSLRSFEWELAQLSQLGLTKKLLVFITETGWMHNQGKTYDPALLSPIEVGKRVTIAAETVWHSAHIAAVTPFVFNYQDVPFDHFSWKRLGDDSYYEHYSAYRDIPKTKGAPRQREQYKGLENLLPPTLVARSAYTLSAAVENTGQGILDNENYSLLITSRPEGFSFSYGALPTVEPNRKGLISATFKTPEKEGAYIVSLTLMRQGTPIWGTKRTVTIVPPPSLHITARLGWRVSNTAHNAKVLIYDDKTLIHEVAGLALTNGVIRVTNLINVIPGKRYRIVLIIPYYLPRQIIQPLFANETRVLMPRLLPLDINGDGKFSVADIREVFHQKPHVIIRRAWGL